MRAHLSNLFATRPYLLAIACMILSTASFSAMNVCIREASGELHTTVIVAIRNFLAVLILLPFMLRGGRAMFRTARIKSHFWRALIGLVGMQTWFYCISTLPLNHATALSFTAPLFTSLFAVLFLKEHAGAARWAALAAGFLGTLVILRPDPADFEWQSLTVMLATSMWAVAGMLVKSLTRTEPPLRIIFYMALFMFVFAVPFALPHWQWPDGRLWMLLGAIAVFSTFAHWSLVKAYSLARVVQIMPFDFTRLVFTALFAYLAFGETSDLMTWLGAAIIVASAVAIARRDAKAAALAASE